MVGIGCKCTADKYESDLDLATIGPSEGKFRLSGNCSCAITNIPSGPLRVSQIAIDWPEGDGMSELGEGKHTLGCECTEDLQDLGILQKYDVTGGVPASQEDVFNIDAGCNCRYYSRKTGVIELEDVEGISIKTKLKGEFESIIDKILAQRR